MFRAEGVPVYGHVGLRFDAKSAQLCQTLRDRRCQDLFDKILLRCVKQIQDDVQLNHKSTIFVIPDSLHGDFTPFQVKDVMEYLLVALREDRQFTVVQVNANTIYIRWSAPAPLKKEAPPIKFNDAPKKKTQSSSTTAAAPRRVTYVQPPPQQPSSRNQQKQPQSGNIDELLASLNI
jgi:hypothetical protein